MCAYFNFRVRMVDGLGLELGDWQLERAKAGAERASALAEERGVAMPSDPWGVRQGVRRGVRQAQGERSPHHAAPLGPCLRRATMVRWE